MEEQTNLFLKILKIGVDLQGEVICFNEIIETIKSEFKVSEKMISAIRRWFYDYYYLSETFRMNKGMLITLPDYDLKKHDNEMAYFTGDGYFKYYEYLEVRKAYDNAQIAIVNAEESSKQAKKSLQWVIVSFVCAFTLGVIQVLLMVVH